MARRSLSVCLPAYNEERTVGGVVEEADSLLARTDLDYEILVCDDGSTDRTGAIVEAVAAGRPRVRVLRHARNEGIRATFEHLYREASRELVFLNATDRQWDTAVVLDMLPLAEDWDIVVASRRIKPYSPPRQLVSWAFNLVPPLLFGVRTVDAGAVKLVRREVIVRLPIVSRSPFSEAERLIRAQRAGYRITQMPVEGVRRMDGRGRGASARLVLTAAADVVRVWLALRRAAAPTLRTAPAGLLSAGERDH